MLFTINQTTAPTRRESLNGQEFLVVPVVALREGVLNDELMLAEEFSHGFEAWNGRAVTIGHPELHGENVSANTPGMLDEIAVGQLFNTSIRGDRMVSEMWIDLSRVPLVDGGPQAVKQFESATLTDVSTAYLRDLEEKPGTFKGEAHNGIQRNIKPDHLAILLDEEGACSIKDGCGAPRINRLSVNDKHNGVMIALMLPEQVANDMAIDGGEPANELHVTLAYLGDKKNVDKDVLLDAVREFTNGREAIAGKTNGIGRFSNQTSDGTQAFYINFDSPALPEFRQSLVNALAKNGIDVASDHGFTPHITLAFLDTNTSIPFDNVDERLIEFESVSVAHGDEVTTLDLAGKRDKETVKQVQNETWIIRQLKRLAARYNYRLEANMSREELMRHLSTMEGNIFNDEDMAEMSQSALEKLAALLQANQPPPDEEEPPEDETPGRTPEEEEMEALKLNQDGDSEGDNVSLTDDEPTVKEIQEQLADFAVQIQANAAALQAKVDNEKAPFVEAIIANSTMTAEQIGGFDLPTLKALRVSVVPADYSGQGGGPQQTESGWQIY